MKHSVSLALALLVGCATGAAVSQFVVPPVRAGTAPQRWEYVCRDDLEAGVGGLDANLNKFGAAGWELVSAHHEQGSFGHQWATCFKRALP